MKTFNLLKKKPQKDIKLWKNNYSLNGNPTNSSFDKKSNVAPPPVDT